MSKFFSLTPFFDGDYSEHESSRGSKSRAFFVVVSTGVRFLWIAVMFVLLLTGITAAILLLLTGIASAFIPLFMTLPLSLAAFLGITLGGGIGGAVLVLASAVVAAIAMVVLKKIGILDLIEIVADKAVKIPGAIIGAISYCVGCCCEGVGTMFSGIGSGITSCLGLIPKGLGAMFRGIKGIPGKFRQGPQMAMVNLTGTSGLDLGKVTVEPISHGRGVGSTAMVLRNVDGANAAVAQFNMVLPEGMPTKDLQIDVVIHGRSYVFDYVLKETPMGRSGDDAFGNGTELVSVSTAPASR